MGKTGLALALTGQPFQATISSHARQVWTLESHDVELPTGRQESRETLLWDLAGQPAYRLIHRLHLHDAAVGLVVHDARSETDPFAGVDYWARSLAQAGANFPMVKLLVSARIDRGGTSASRERTEEVQDRLGLNANFETSSLRGDGVEKLKHAIGEAILWDDLPFVTTPEIFAKIKDFLINEKEEGRVLTTPAYLLNRYLSGISNVEHGNAKEAFQACLGLLETAGLIRQLSFGNLVLLQPEMLDSYCSWIALAARSEPDGLGYILEERALSGDFPMDRELQVQDKAMEPSILLATVQEVVGRGLAVRQGTLAGNMLVFPSELRRDFPDYPGGRVLAVAFQFDGPVRAIYATLTVSLIHSLTFQRYELYKNTALFWGPGDQACGFGVEYPNIYDDSRWRLTVFFDVDVERNIRLLFLRYVNQQLEKLALNGTVTRQRIFMCPEPDCQYLIPQEVVEGRRELDENTVVCPIHMRHIPLDDLVEEVQLRDGRVNQIEANASEERQRQERLTVLKRREESLQFDTFLCHNSKDKPYVLSLRDKLSEQGILAWIDEEGILAGEQFVTELESILDRVPCALVVVGPNWMGRWQQQEYYALLQRYVEHRSEGAHRLRLIPVLLPGVPSRPRLPTFLRGFNYVDFRAEGLDDRKEIARLVRAILSEEPEF